MNDTIKLIASELANKNRILEPKDNSVIKLVLGANVTEFNNVVEEIASKVTNEIGVYKNIFMPMLKEYIEIVNNIIVDRSPKSDISKYRINVVAIPDYIKELVKKGAVPNNGNIFELPISSLSIPAPDNIRDYFKSTSASEYMLIEELLTNKSDEDLKNIWEKYLLNVSGTNDAITNFRYKALGNIEEAALLIALVSNLKVNPPEKYNVKPDTYNNIMQTFYRKLMEDISLAIEEYDSLVDINILFLNSDDKYTINVIKPVYNKFLKDASVDVLLGYAISEDKSAANRALNNVLVKKDEYLNKWNSHVKLTNLANKLESSNLYRLAYTFAVPELLKDIPSSVAEYISDDTDFIRNYVEGFVKALNADQLHDVYKTSSYILATMIMDKNNNFYRFLLSMEEYKRLDKTLDQKETASLATLDLITKYILQQLELK